MKTKQHLLLGAMAMGLACTLGACQNDGETVDLTVPIDLSFTPGVQTRAIIAETGETFEAGDRVGVFLSTADANQTAAIGQGAAVNNEPFTRQSGGSWSGTLYWQNISQWHTFHAYYPYDAALNGTTVTTKSVTVVQDQHAGSGAGYKAADYLWGVSQPTQATNNSITVQLQHCMARHDQCRGGRAGYNLADNGRYYPRHRQHGRDERHRLRLHCAGCRDADLHHPLPHGQ